MAVMSVILRLRRHIVRKWSATNKTPCQNNADILIWSAGCLLQFGEERREKNSLVFFFFAFERACLQNKMYLIHFEDLKARL